jgi:hypothetical protein
VKKAFLAYFKVFSQHFSGGSLRNYKRPARIAGLRAEVQQDNLWTVTDELKNFKNIKLEHVVTQYAKNAQEDVEL